MDPNLVSSEHILQRKPVETTENSDKPPDYSEQMGNLRAQPLSNPRRRRSWSFYGLQVAFCALLLWVVVINLGLYFMYSARDPSGKIKERDEMGSTGFVTLEGIIESFLEACKKNGLDTLYFIQPETLHEFQNIKTFQWSKYAQNRKSSILTFLSGQETLPQCHPTLANIASAIEANFFCKNDRTHAMFGTPASTFYLVSAKTLNQRYLRIPALNDSSVSENLWNIGGITEQSPLLFLNYIGIFELQALRSKKTVVDGIELNLPEDLRRFQLQLNSSEFLPCDTQRTEKFYRDFPEMMETVSSREGQDFKRKARHILKLLSDVLYDLGVPFWISSGTLLGWFRQCDVIPYSVDVDVGVHISDHSSDILTLLEDKGLQLRMKLGLIEDSLQYSFLYKGMKLDIYFFYPESESTVWNGATKPETGEKFKYIFPSFELCWTDFLDLILRVPCPTLPYVEANYGTDWFVPVKNWDWQLSPPNSRNNGKWSEAILNETVQIFDIN